MNKYIFYCISRVQLGGKLSNFKKMPIPFPQQIYFWVTILRNKYSEVWTTRLFKDVCHSIVYDGEKLETAKHSTPMPWSPKWCYTHWTNDNKAITIFMRIFKKGLGKCL